MLFCKIETRVEENRWKQAHRDCTNDAFTTAMCTKVTDSSTDTANIHLFSTMIKDHNYGYAYELLLLWVFIVVDPKVHGPLQMP
jgi:hypothetical protein